MPPKKDRKRSQTPGKVSAKAAAAKKTASSKKKAASASSRSPSPSASKRSRSRSPSPLPSRKSVVPLESEEVVASADAGAASSSDDNNSISLLTAPLSTLYYFGWATSEFVGSTTVSLVGHPGFYLGAVPLLGVYLGSKLSKPELYSSPADCSGVDLGGPLWYFELVALEFLWWLLLGILSSVGFGTGLHSGIMFLFPHVMSVCFAAESCPIEDMCSTLYLHPCKFQCTTKVARGTEIEASFLTIWSRVLFPLMTWGLGTAFGELPPYFISRAASQASGAMDEELAEEMEKAEKGTDPFSKMKMWTVEFTKKWDFLGVFLLASWPNAAFDMCGMCCGYLQMPFWSFFIATALGKGVVKVNGQAIFFIALFGKAFFQIFAVPLANYATSFLKTLEKTFPFLAPYKLGSIDVAAKLNEGRLKVIRKFEMQSRYLFDQVAKTEQIPIAGAAAAAATVAGAAKSKAKAKAAKVATEEVFGLGKETLKELYGKFEKPGAYAKRIIAHWDTDGNKILTEAEIHEAISSTDNKFSLGSLDPLAAGSADSWAKVLWDGFLASMIAFFFYCIINQVAATKYAEVKSGGKGSVDDSVLATAPKSAAKGASAAKGKAKAKASSKMMKKK